MERRTVGRGREGNKRDKKPKKSQWRIFVFVGKSCGKVHVGFSFSFPPVEYSQDHQRPVLSGVGICARVTPLCFFTPFLPNGSYVEIGASSLMARHLRFIRISHKLPSEAMPAFLTRSCTPHFFLQGETQVYV